MYRWLALIPLQIAAVVFLLLLNMVVTCKGVTAQVPHFRNYSTENGLPSSETYAITQDSKGYIYIGTDKGLARFDGDKFYTYKKAHGLVDNTIFGFHHTGDTLWYFTYTSQLGYIHDNKLFAYQGNSNLRNIPFQNTLFLIGSDSTGLLLNIRYANTYQTIRALGTGYSNLEITTTPDNLVIQVPPSGGYCLLSGTKKSKQIFIHDPKTGNKRIKVPSSKDDIAAAFAYRTKDGGLLINIGNAIYKIKNDECTKIISCNGSVLFVFQDREENIWVGYHNKGLSLYRKADNYTYPEYMLPGHSVSCIFQDREQGMWFTTLENGIFYLSPQPLYSYDKIGSGISKTLRICWLDDAPAVLQSDHSVFHLHKNNSWVQTFTGKHILSVSDNYGSAPVYFTSIELVKDHPLYKHVNEAKILDVSRQIWATSSNKVISYELQTLKCSDRFIVNEVIICGLEVDNGKFLVGTTKGLLVYDRGKQYWIKQLVRDRIANLRRAGENIIVCTKSQGVFIINRHNFNVVRHFPSLGKLKDALCTVAVYGPDSTLWIGTNKGICKISSGLHDTEGCPVWIDKYNGLISDEVNDILIHGNKAWVATARGLSLIPVDSDFTYKGQVPLDLKPVLVNGKIWTGKTPQFRYDQNNITFQFSGLCYMYAGAVGYKYRLLHSGDESWHYTDNPSVNYNALSDGRYLFECMAIVPNQNSTNRSTSFSFSITPPFWKTRWFIVISILLVAAGAMMFIHYRIRFLRRQLLLKADLDAYRDKALRDQMSPHFIYNSLNTIQNSILEQDTRKAMSFLSRFSRLMRLTFHNTGKTLTTIESDLAALKLYVEMEQMRFPGRFEVALPELSVSLQRALIPPLLIQPFVENAILHGVLPKKTIGHIRVNIEEAGSFLIVTIQDNGMGRATSTHIKDRQVKYIADKFKAESDTAASGTTVTIARIKQAWQNTNNHYFHIEDLYNGDGPSGTLVTFYLPYKYDNSNNSG